jgi:CheY-like chemotaxis protein
MTNQSAVTVEGRISYAPVEIARSRVILIADDDDLAQQILGHLAEKRGHHIVQTTSGSAVCAVAFETQPDLIVLDIGFPDADGRDVLRALKAIPQTAHIPVLIWSGRKSNPSDARISLELGAEDYVEKSDPYMFMVKIERVLARMPPKQCSLEPFG